MRPNLVSLVLYFIICLAIIVLKIVACETFVVYFRALLIPIIFTFYFISNNYIISGVKAGVYLLCFIADLIGAVYCYSNELLLPIMLCYMAVYFLLLYLSIIDFKNLKYKKSDRLPMLILAVIIITIAIWVLNLDFENLKPDFVYFLIYGIFLSLLSFVSISNYLKNGNYIFFNLLLMALFYLVSDISYLINKFYLELYMFGLLEVGTEAFSFYFMTVYFLENDTYHKKKAIG